MAYEHAREETTSWIIINQPITAHPLPSDHPLTEVVAQPSYAHTQHILVSDAQLGLLLSNGAHELSSQMSHTRTWMCKSDIYTHRLQT